jgi:ankyrin repeat protein
VPTIPLPSDPHLENLRNRARKLQRAVRAQQPEALALIAEHHPDQLDIANFPLSAAQLVVARSYGFASWPRLKKHLDTVAAFRRDPDVLPDEESGDDADRFCRFACLMYSSDDGPERWERARELLADNPALSKASIWTAAAAGDATGVREWLSKDPSLANRQGGPHRWEPLLYLAYSRVGGGSPLEAAGALLAAGADPNGGYLWKGECIFTALTGVFGEGEQGRGRQPRHPREGALARLLLVAGADPNDDQTLYNRMFFPDNSHLELLFEYGLGNTNKGPWLTRLNATIDSVTATLRGQLVWAIKHGFVDRVGLLIDHGVDFLQPFTDVPRLHQDGRTPVQLASAEGHRDIVAQLVAAGAAQPNPSPAEQLVGACLAADRPTVKRLLNEHPGLLDEVRGWQPALMVRAAELGRPDVVAVVAETGFDPNALADGTTALHDAAWRGDVPIIEALLAVGADPDKHDRRFDSTPLGWARYAYQDAAVAALTL